MFKPNLMVVYGGGTVGGAEEYLFALMKKIDKDRFGKIIFASLGDAPLVERVKKLAVQVEVIPYSHHKPIQVLKNLRRVVEEEKVTLINSHGLRSNTFCRLLGKTTKVPVVTTVHSVLKYDYASPVKRFIAQSMENLTRPITRQFIAVSNAVAKDIITQGVNPDQVVVIQNGIDLSRLSKLDEAAIKAMKASLGIKAEEKVVGIVARLQQVKGHKYFLEAAQAISRSYSSVKFLVIGDGPLRQELESQVKQLELTNQVIFTGFRSDINELVSIMDVFCMSSLMEGLPLAPLEAMALGTPVVATAVGGLKEIITDGEEGFLVPPREPAKMAAKILDLLKQADLAAEMAVKGQQLVKQSYDFDKMVVQVEDVFVETAKKYSPIV